MSIKAILFDLGGVFLELDFSNFYDKIISPSPLNKPQAPLMLRFFRQSDIYHEGKMSDEEFYNLACDILQANKEQLSQTEFFDAFNSIISSINKEMVEMLKKLKEHGKYKLLAISNINSSHWEYLQGQECDFIDYFDELILSHEVHITKPNHKIFQIAIEQANCEPEEILYIDDGLNNVKSARELGIKGLNFTDTKDLISKFEELGIHI
ncbi:MAG: HAD-IA family hydrolase [Candidatus Lokiarchaeota archaeon]|nr:HAD-IA family hydrolase [Candidatus Lokiarchaeota archaeon]